MSKADDDFIALARDRFDQGQTAGEAQSQRENNDLSFYAGNQWEPTQITARAGLNSINGLPPVPARPTLTINKVREPVRTVLNSEEQADFTLQIVAADDFGELVPENEENTKEIELREGLLRMLQRTPEAQDARLWAASRAAISGTGWYRVMTRFLPGKTWDKEIYTERIFDQSSITADPAHEQPDGSDCDWLFDGVLMPIDRYEAEHGKRGNRVSEAAGDSGEWTKLCSQYPNWFKQDGKTRSVLVMNYWYTERETQSLCLLADGSSVYRSELPKDFPKAQIVDEREETKKIIKWCKIDGAQVLDETDWEGPDMPYVKVLGEELHPFDDERRAEGMVRPMRDAGVGFNAMVSKLVEVVGLAPIPSLMVQEGTVAGFETWYQLAATRTLPYLPYRAVNAMNQPANPPTTVPRDPPIQPIAMALQVLDEAIKSTTAVPDTQLGHQDPTVKSGKMADTLIAQSQLSTSHFLKNLQRSMRYEGQIENNLLYPIYGTRPGRLARIVDGSGDSKSVRIGAGQSQAPMQMAQQPGAVLGLQQPPKTYTLSKDANYNVVVKVTKNPGTLRQEEAATMGSMIEASPPLIAVLGDLFFANQDGPGHKEAAERMKVMLDPKVQQMLAQKEQGGPRIPPQVMQQMAQQKQQLDDAHLLLQKAAQELQGKQAELDNKIQLQQMSDDTKKEIAAADRETKITVAELGAKVDRIALFLEERARIGLQEHEARQALSDHAHEAVMAGQAQQHAMASGAADAGTAADQQMAQQQHEAEMSAQQQEYEAPGSGDA